MIPQPCNSLQPHQHQADAGGGAWQLGVTGILVLDAKEGGPAWKAGIHGTKRDDWGRLVYGDIITEFQGNRVRCGLPLAPYSTRFDVCA